MTLLLSTILDGPVDITQQKVANKTTCDIIYNPPRDSVWLARREWWKLDKWTTLMLISSTGKRINVHVTKLWTADRVINNKNCVSPERKSIRRTTVAFKFDMLEFRRINAISSTRRCLPTYAGRSPRVTQTHDRENSGNEAMWHSTSRSNERLPQTGPNVGDKCVCQNI